MELKSSYSVVWCLENLSAPPRKGIFPQPNNSRSPNLGEYVSYKGKAKFPKAIKKHQGIYNTIVFKIWPLQTSLLSWIQETNSALEVELTPLVASNMVK